MYKTGQRLQATFLPPSIENYVSETDPVRVYDAFVQQLDLKQLGFCIDERQSGPSQYHPALLLKILLYGLLMDAEALAS